MAFGWSCVGDLYPCVHKSLGTTYCEVGLHCNSLAIYTCLKLQNTTVGMSSRWLKKLRTVILVAVFILLLYEILMPENPEDSTMMMQIPPAPLVVLDRPRDLSRKRNSPLFQNPRLIKQFTSSDIQPPIQTRSSQQSSQALVSTLPSPPHKFPSPPHKFPSLGKIRVVELTGGSPEEQAKQVEGLDSNPAGYSEEWMKTLTELQQQYPRIGSLHKLPVNTSNNHLQRSYCMNKLCSEFLTRLDTPHFKYCWRKSRLRSRKEPEKSTCHFISGIRRSPVALASFPGSGNTWARGLLQDTTGICTGGIYCDTTLRKNGYPGECIRSGVVLVVKTHETAPWWTGVQHKKSEIPKYFVKNWHIPVYSAAIFLMRDPYDALVAEWNREKTERHADNHVNYVGREHFRDNQEWNEFVHTQAVEWQKTVLGWVVNSAGHPVIVVKYEDMKRNTSKELERMLHFLQVPYTETQFQRVVTRGYNMFKRLHSPKDDFEYFTLEQSSFVDSVVRTTLTELEEVGLADKCNVTSYLLSH